VIDQHSLGTCQSDQVPDLHAAQRAAQFKIDVPVAALRQRRLNYNNRPSELQRILQDLQRNAHSVKRTTVRPDQVETPANAGRPRLPSKKRDGSFLHTALAPKTAPGAAVEPCRWRDREMKINHEFARSIAKRSPYIQAIPIASPLQRRERKS
jgi:hypothetical protein